MFVPRPTSPLALEPPLSSISPEYDDDNSDSESDLDKNARAAKKRRIEQLGQDYLEGKPLLIFTASLKGPFDDGWDNPWKRTNKRTKNRVPCATNSTRTSRPSSRKLVSVTPKSPHVPPSREVRHVSESETGSKHRTGKERQIQISRAQSSSRQRNSTDSSTNANLKSIRPDQLSERSRSKRNRKSDNPWLKKDGEGLHHDILDLPKSPSPTPNHRPNSAQKSGTEDLQSRDESRNCEKSYLIESRMGGFTPINVPKPHSGSSSRHAGPLSVSTPTEKPQNTPSPSQAASRKPPSGSREPPVPASTKTTHQRNFRSKTSRSAVKQMETDVNTRKSLDVVLPADHLPGHQFHRTDSQRLAQDRPAKQPSHPNTHDTQTSLTQVSVDKGSSTRSSKKAPVMNGATSKEHSNPKSKQPSGNASRDILSTRTESDGITSAQIVPEKAKFPDMVMSLASIEWAGPAKPASEAREVLDGNDAGFSTQAAIATARKSLKDDLAGPEKAPPVLSDDNLTPAQITPFHLFHKPGGTASYNGTNVTNGEANKTQDPIDSINPHDLGTVKNVPFGPSNEGNEREIIVKSEFPTDYRSKPGPVRATAASSVNPKHDLITQKTSGVNDQKPPVPTPADSSARSSGTMPPLTLSTASNGTKQQQDGQAVADLDSFDLNQAIADAGSFLQSWDINRDLCFHSQKNPASSGQAMHSVTSVNGPKGG